MKQIPASRFKATCLEVMAQVNRTGVPVVVTRYGKPIAQIGPIQPKGKKKSWLGCMAGTAVIVGDIVGPIGAFENWNITEP